MSDQQVVESLARVMTMAWADEDYKEQLIENPREVMSAAGIKTPENAVIKINEHDIVANTEGTMESGSSHLDKWFKGYETGVYELDLYLAPAGFDLGNMMLSDAQLDVVAGGAQSTELAPTSEGCCTYCCCPCTCCT